MGLSEKLAPASRGPWGGRDGIALATALFGVVVVTVLAMGMWTIARVNNFSAVNREDAARALNMAEGGATHALGLLRGPLQLTTPTNLLQGSDFTPDTDDDFLLIGYGLSVANMIPPEGIAVQGGTYFVTLMDDPAHPGETDGNPLTDSNGRIIAQCTGVTDTGASATINVVIGVASLPAIGTNGSLLINGNPNILGACGGAHANQVVVVSGTTTVQTQVSASQTVQVSGQINQAGGGASTPLSNQPPIQIPVLNPMNFCGTSDYILQANGMFVDMTVDPPSTVDATSVPVNGWTRGSSNPVEWNLSGNTTASGSYCIMGNVVISGNPGEPPDPPPAPQTPSPIPLSIFANGSVQYSGNPYITAAHPSGALIIANGDVAISGNPQGITDSYNGLIYAQSQCQLNGNPVIGGSILCFDAPDPPGSSNFVNQNGISGNPTMRYECGGMQVGLRMILSWYQAFEGT